MPESIAPIYLRKWRWTRRRVVLAAVITLGASSLIVLYLLLHEPSWYEPPIIAPKDQQLVRNNLVAAEQAFTESLRAGGGPFVYHIYQDDVNRWLSMRREIYPLLDELAPPELADPFVVFDDGKITIAGLYRSGFVSAVISIDLAVIMQADALVLKVTSVRLGSIRMPMGIASRLGLATPVNRSPDETWPGSPQLQGSLDDGLHVGSDARWQNGGVAYRVLDVSIQKGKINLTVEPRGHQGAGVNRKHHSSPAADRASKANRPARH